MIYVKGVGESDLTIKFYHKTDGDEENRGRYTRCEIVSGDDVIGFGEARVFSGSKEQKPDQFDRRIGRKESLARALSDAGMARSERAVIWDAYQAKCKVPRQVK